MNKLNTKRQFDLDMFQKYLAARQANQSKLAEAYRSKLLMDNIQLVQKLAAKHAKKLYCPMDLEEVYQVGCLAFCEYLDRYDSTRGAFSTYIDSWIRHELQKASKCSDPLPNRPRNVHMPMALRRRSDEITTRMGRPPTLTELAEAGSKLDPPIKVTQRDIDRWGQERPYIASMDEEISSHGEESRDEITLHDLIADPDAFDAESALVSIGTRAELADAIVELSPVHQRIVIALFVDGIDRGRVAAQEGRSEEWVRQQRDEALRVLRARMS